MVVKVVITREQLEEIYLVKNYTRDETASYFGVKPRYIKSLVKKFGLSKSQELINQNNKGGSSVGYHWWNNGSEQLFQPECPGDGWVLGRLAVFKDKITGISRNFSEESRDKLAELARERFSGSVLSEEHKQKISDYWKEHEHPLKGKERSQEVKDKISKTLEGHPQVAPKRELIEALTDEQLKQYLDDSNCIQFNKIYSDLGILANQDSWETIKKEYTKRGITFKAYTSTSLFEKEVVEYIKSIYEGSIEENVKNSIIGGEIDIYIPDEKLCIECNGCYWHRTVYEENVGKFVMVDGKSTSYHFQKSKLIREQGLRLIHIWEDQWKNERLQPILKGILKAALNCLDTRRVYARQCELKEVPAEEYKKFCNLNHTQLSRPAEIRLGLYYKGELVQVASFGKYKATNRASDKDKETFDYEWIRGCENFNYSHVIGGVSKLFKYFLNKYNPNSILCYSDFNFFCGLGYDKCGFVLKGYTGSDKFYIDAKTLTRINRSAKHYREYMQKVVSGEWYCCYGAGSLKFVWEKSEQKV